VAGQGAGVKASRRRAAGPALAVRLSAGRNLRRPVARRIDV